MLNVHWKVAASQHGNVKVDQLAGHSRTTQLLLGAEFSHTVDKELRQLS